ncbi:MAG: hypothetical protein WAU36_11940 [Cyclobacteriaceae bacterium]
MKTQDEKLQESIEQGKLDATDVDSQAYQVVFNAINEEPETLLHPQFSDRIISRIIKIEEQRASQRDLIWLGIGIFVLIATAIFTIVFTGFTLNSGAFKFIGNYGGLLVFAACLIVLFQWVEKKVLPHKEPT